MNGSSATLRCATDGDFLTWTFGRYIRPDDYEYTDAIDQNCKSVVAFVDANQSRPNACDLIVKDTVEKATLEYLCQDGDSIGRGIVIFLGKS